MNKYAKENNLCFFIDSSREITTFFYHRDFIRWEEKQKINNNRLFHLYDEIERGETHRIKIGGGKSNATVSLIGFLVGETNENLIRWKYTTYKSKKKHSTLEYCLEIQLDCHLFTLAHRQAAGIKENQVLLHKRERKNEEYTRSDLHFNLKVFDAYDTHKKRHKSSATNTKIRK